MLQAINSKRKSEGNDCTENISDQAFEKLNAIYFIPDDFLLQGAKEQGNQWGPFHRASGIINTKLVKIAYLNVSDVSWLLGGILHIVEFIGGNLQWFP